MKHYSIHDKYIALSASSSKGTQIKYFKNNNWYKIDNVGREGLAEEIASKLLQCSNHADYVMYEKCVINGKNGCKSANFLGDGEESESCRIINARILWSFWNVKWRNISLYFIEEAI